MQFSYEIHKCLLLGTQHNIKIPTYKMLQLLHISVFTFRGRKCYVHSHGEPRSSLHLMHLLCIYEIRVSTSIFYLSVVTFIYFTHLV